MNKISYELTEVILSFLQNEELVNFMQTCKENYLVVKDTEKVGCIYTTQIINCSTCFKLKVFPIIINIKNEQIADNIKICSLKCKIMVLCKFPRCYFCFSSIQTPNHSMATRNRLFCSQDCVSGYMTNHRRDRIFLIR